MPTLSLKDIQGVIPAEQATVEDRVRAAATRHGVDPNLAWSVARQESRGNQGWVSPKGAIGVMQLMPGTAADLGVDPHNEEQNIDGGVRYLRQMLDRHKGDQTLALASYNAGPGAVDKYGGVPPYVETQNYVKNVEAGAPFVGPRQPRTAPPPAAPVLVAQAGPVGQPMQVSQPVRSMATQQAPIAYDPYYGDPNVGPKTFQGISVLHKTGLATMSPLYNWIPEGGGKPVTAYSVVSPHAAHTGLWTVDGRKLDPSKNWSRDDGMGGGSDNLQRYTATDSRTGESHVYVFNPKDGSTFVVPDQTPVDSAGLNLIWGYNHATKKTGYFAKEHLKADPQTGSVTNRLGQVIEPTPMPHEIADMKQRLTDWQASEYSRLEAQYLGWQGAVKRGELASLRMSFGIPLPVEYEGDKTKAEQWLNSYMEGRKKQIEKVYTEKLQQIQQNFEHIGPSTPAPPAAAGQIPTAGTGRRVVKGGDL